MFLIQIFKNLIFFGRRDLKKIETLRFFNEKWFCFQIENMEFVSRPMLGHLAEWTLGRIDHTASSPM